MLVFTLVILIVGIFLLVNSLGFFSGAPYAPTSRQTIKLIFQELPLTKRDVVYDLGSGDGRVLEEAARRGIRGVGFEINPALYLWSRFHIHLLGRSKLVTFHLGNFWNKPIESASVVFAFLLPEFMPRLEAKIERESLKGTYIITHLAQLPDHKPKFILGQVYIYQL